MILQLGGEFKFVGNFVHLLRTRKRLAYLQISPLCTNLNWCSWSLIIIKSPFLYLISLCLVPRYFFISLEAFSINALGDSDITYTSNALLQSSPSFALCNIAPCHSTCGSRTRWGVYLAPTPYWWQSQMRQCVPQIAWNNPIKIRTDSSVISLFSVSNVSSHLDIQLHTQSFHNRSVRGKVMVEYPRINCR